MKVMIEPPSDLSSLVLTERGQARGRTARVLIANLPRAIAERELAAIGEKLSWEPACLRIEAVSSRGPGNVVLLEVESEHVSEVFAGFGERGVRAETVAEQVVLAARRYLASDVAVGEHLADQLLLPMTLAKGGVFTTLPPSRHTLTGIHTIGRFLSTKIQVSSDSNRACTVEIVV